ALHLPNDQTGDCNLFTRNLARMAQDLGVEFRLGCTVQSMSCSGDRITGVYIDGVLETAEKYVVALGSYSREILAPLGVKIPVYPLKGYSLTVPITDPALAPQSTIIDETYKVAITRFDQRIRIAGMAQISGF